ncbi:choline transporter-like protein 4 isoform X2 [Microcaecilia unicolor]|uniref:Choline transporter-like protein n=1 Tax=Microcaecilia unicolor TaxID=1415580 RepID=A0A6P7XR74_9AMPH|nr:choline transporter-like protein 4 isoform X2 [Microcaecilia unicolor]
MVKVKDAGTYGDPAKYDPTFRGPIKNRSCTDIICCFLFMVFIIGYMIVGIVAWIYGDPRQVIYPRNSSGMYCDFGQNKGKPYLLYFDLLKCIVGTNVMASALNGMQCPTTQICVASCPENFTWITPMFGKPNEVFNQMFCQPQINLSTTTMSVQDIAKEELCPPFTIPSRPFFNRCFPKSNLVYPLEFTTNNIMDNATKENITGAFNAIVKSFDFQHVGKKIFQDFALSWYWIAVALGIAMLVSFLFLILLRFIAGILVWVLIIGLLGVLAYGIYHCYKEYDTLKKEGQSIKDIQITTNLTVLIQVQETWLAFLIILAVVEGMLLLILLFLRKRIVIAIALIKEASKAIGQMMSALFYPLITFVLLIICVAYWGMTALYLATSGEPLFRLTTLNSSAPNCSDIDGNQTCDPITFNITAYACKEVRCIFYKYNTDGLYQRNLFNLQIYNIFGFLWCINFVIALGQCVLAGAFASYYWAFNKPKDIPCFPVAGAFMRTLRYHTGSLAFGALILTIVQMIRMVLEYLDHKVKDSHNAFARFLMCCLKCCFWCLEKFIKFLNRNAYIMIAVYGKNFCTSAKNAFSLLMRNILRVVILDKVTDLLLFFGKLLVVGGVGVLAFFFFSGRIPIDDDKFKNPTLNYYWIPILTVVLGSYMIAQGFFSVYNMCVDTLFLCFLEDLERNDGSEQKPYYMPKSLMSILNKNNKLPKS